MSYTAEATVTRKATDDPGCNVVKEWTVVFGSDEVMQAEVRTYGGQTERLQTGLERCDVPDEVVVDAACMIRTAADDLETSVR